MSNNSKIKILTGIIALIIPVGIFAQTGSPSVFQDEWVARNIENPVNYTEIILPSNNANQSITIYLNDTISKVLPSHFGGNAAGWINNKVFNQGDPRIRHFRNANLKFVRWPGGNWSNIYFWDGNVPTDLKVGIQAISGTATGNNTWQLSLLDFLKMADSIHAEPVICVNYSYARYGADPNALENAAKYAADFVRFVNGTLGANVRYWEVGNENYGQWQAGYVVNGDTINGEEYGDGFCVFVDSMKTADPNIIIGAGAVPDDGDSYKSYNHWTRRMLPSIQEKADFLIVHEYFTPPAPNDYTPSQILANLSLIEQNMREMCTMVEKYTNKSANHFPIALTEYNIRQGPLEISHFSGMFITQAIGEVIKNNYGMLMHWDLQNGYQETGGDHGMIANKEPGIEQYTPYSSLIQYYMYGKYHGDVMIRSTSSSAKIISYAFKSSSEHITLVIINHENSTQNIELKINENIEWEGWLYWHEITASDYYSSDFSINGIAPSTGHHAPPNYDSIVPYSSIFDKNTIFKAKLLSINYILIESNYLNTAIHKPIMKNTPWCYSNPWNDEIMINYPPELGKGSFVILDYTGKQLFQSLITGSKSIYLPLKQGIYILKIEACNKLFASKILKL